MSYALLELVPGPSPQEVVMAPAIRGPIAFGPRVVQPGTVIPPIVARLYRRDDLNEQIAELDQSFERQWQDQLDESGSARISLTNDDPDLALLEHSDVIRFELHGWAAFAMLIRSRETVVVAEGEEHDMVTTLAGPGHFAIFDEALVYPARGPGVLPAEEDRFFNWTSVDYDDSAWRHALNIASVNYSAANWELQPFAEGFPPFTAAQTIWGIPNGFSEVPPGHNYFRRTYTSSGGALIFVVIDDGGEVYIDGQLVLECHDGFGQVYTYALPDVTPGEHTIAVHGENGPGSPTEVFDNPAAIAMAIYPCDANGQPTSAYPDLITDDQWLVVPYPPRPPGMTPGEVVRHVIEEARARGALPPIELNFTDEYDSAGTPWPEVTDISTKTGTDVLTFLRELSATYVELWLEPASWRLWAWVKGTRGDDQGIALVPVTDPSDPFSGNLSGLILRSAF